MYYYHDWQNSVMICVPNECIDLSTDEKKVFDPTQFQETIVQGLNQTGSDLDAVAKFLDASGAKLDYRRYAETLFDILVAGGMLGKDRMKCWGKDRMECWEKDRMEENVSVRCWQNKDQME